MRSKPSVLAAAALAAAVIAGGHQGLAERLDPPFHARHDHGHGGNTSAPAPCEDGLAGAHAGGGEVMMASDAMRELVTFVREQGWGLEVDLPEECTRGELVTIVGAGMSAAGERGGGGREDAHEGTGV